MAMSRKTGTLVFILAFIVTFLGSIALVTRGNMLSMMALAAFPLIFCSELIAFGMVYASIYYDGHEEEAALEAEAKSHAKH